MKYIHVNLYERQRIERYLKQGQSRRFIAAKLDRSVSSISDEINNNSVHGEYVAMKAHTKSKQRRFISKVQCMKVSTDIALKNFVIEEMTHNHQSPEGISGRLKHVMSSLQYASTKAIYKFVKSVGGRQIEKYLYSKSVHKKSGPKRGTPVTIDGRITVDHRPHEVDFRLEFGHFEGDYIESGKDGKGSLLVLIERKTRYPFIVYLENKTTSYINNVVATTLRGLHIKSLTIDNDISFQKHEELSELINATIFFCHPQCPHEKGTVENRNKAIRRYMKKKSDLSSFSLDYIAEVERKLRDRFMACLNFKTPREMFELELQKQKEPRKSGMMKERLLM